MKERDSEGLRQALGQFATGVTIVTTAGADDEPIGVTANSFNSVSLDPPLVLWSLSTAAFSRKSFESAAYFCVHILAASQEALSQKFASPGANKFGDLKFVRGLGSVPMLEECVVRFQCRMTNQHPVGDHIVFVGEVLKFDNSDKRPLVFHGGRYALADRRMLQEFALRLDGTESRHGDRRAKRKTPP
jgi:3-hydroxy-9,10-secoandrosta-1,3,5(10)-triene-9,17-dione monooxygenase reductase component